MKRFERGDMGHKRFASPRGAWEGAAGEGTSGQGEVEDGWRTGGGRSFSVKEANV